MANITKLKKDLKELQEGIKNPNIPDNIKSGMNETIAELEAQIIRQLSAATGEGEKPAGEKGKSKGKRGRPRKIKQAEDAPETELAEEPATQKPKGKRGRPRKKHKAKRIYFVNEKTKMARAAHIRQYSRKKGSKKRKPIEKEEAQKRITKYIFRRKRKHTKHPKYISKPKTIGATSVGTKGLLKLASKLHADVFRLESAIKKLKTRKEKAKKQPSEKEIKMRLRREMYQALKKKLKFHSGGNA